MSERIVTFAVNQSQLFDSVAALSGETSDLGNKLVSALLAEPGAIERIGMAIYGLRDQSYTAQPRPRRLSAKSASPSSAPSHRWRRGSE